MATAIEFNHVGKQYRLGLVSTGTISHDLNRWWQTAILRKEDPYLKIGSVNDRTQKADSDYVWALRDIDFKVEQGDVVGIIGKNGAGKSTLLKLLSKVTGPTVGTIRARGRIASLLEVGTGFHPEMTGRENIYMNGAIMGMTKAEIAAKLDEIVAFSGCEKYIDTPVKRYSSGMTVRLGFAVAAFMEPDILVVDEVLAVGDLEFQKKAVGKMQDVSKGEGRTVLFVSHNMASVRQLCNTGVLLENGIVKYSGNINDTVDQYMRGSCIGEKDIKDSITKCKNTVQIDTITINGSTSNQLAISAIKPQMKIQIKGNLSKAQKLSVEIRLRDTTDVPIMLYSPHHANSPMLPIGEFVIEEILTLPTCLMSGNYFGSIFLTNSMVEGIVDIPNAFTLEYEGQSTVNGYQFSYDSINGFLFLDK